MTQILNLFLAERESKVVKTNEYVVVSGSRHQFVIVPRKHRLAIGNWSVRNFPLL